MDLFFCPALLSRESHIITSHTIKHHPCVCFIREIMIMATGKVKHIGWIVKLTGNKIAFL